MKNITVPKDNLDFADFRYQAITTLAQDWKSLFTGILHKKGAVAEYTAFAKFSNQLNISFPIPNMTALLLNLSYKLYIESQKGIDNLQTNTQGQSKNFFVPNVASFFDLLEERIASVVFAYTALEVFANEHIPSKYSYTKQGVNKKCEETYNKEQIERWVDLDEKLTMILPQILNVPNPKSNKLWGKYKILKDLRNNLIHIKSKDLLSVNPTDDSIWNKIAVKNFNNFAVIVKEIITLYLSNVADKPRWFIKLPF